MNSEDNSVSIRGNVSGDNVAIGAGAKATKNTYYGVQPSQEELVKALSDLRSGLEALQLNVQAREVVEEDIKKLEEITKQDTPNIDAVDAILKGLTGKLKMVGVVIAEVSSLAGPLAAIAKIVGVSLKALGIG